ncbi:right-handed parallel beta-helix repeat-containing protein [bacterium]|nr:right-handed parallel beta-helix repeat-containing protein [bacterium]
MKTIKLGVATVITLVFAMQATALEVSGILSDTTWTAAESPIRVTGDLVLPDGAELVIEPGVLVEFTGPFSFLIEGKLVAVGNSSNRIVFTSENPDSVDLLWKGLRFVNSDRGCQLVFCDIEYGWARGVWPKNCGGGIYLEGSSPDIRRCNINFNRADGDGGGVYAIFTTTTFRNNLFVENYSGNFGGGMFLAYAVPMIFNCTFVLNTAFGWGGGLFIGSDGGPDIVNCIIAYNLQDKLDDEIPSGEKFFPNLAQTRSADPHVAFTCIEHPSDPYTGPGNINIEPQFILIDDDPYDLHLKLSSPCIDAGDPEWNPGAEPDVLINRINMGAYGGTEEAALSLPVIVLHEFGHEMNFASIRVNSQTSREITINNLGHYRLFISDFSFSLPVFFPDSTSVDGELKPSYLAAPIEPGESAKYSLSFLPTELITYTDTLFIPSNDTINPVPFLPLTGTGIDPIAQCQDSLFFGDGQIDDEHEERIYVRNIGSSDLSISSVIVQGDAFDASIEDGTIVPGTSGVIIIDFLPTHPEQYEGSIIIRTNDRDINVGLTGKGVGPKMVIEIDTLFMGYVYANAVDGDTAVYPVWIFNQGSETLEIDQDSLSVSDPAFSFNVPTETVEIARDDSAEISVCFHPPRPNEDFSDDLTVKSNYPVPHVIELSGRGMAEPGVYVFGDVGGHVWEWDDGHEDYIILDSVSVPPHELLKIMPGARILFEPGAKMLVDGELRAVGVPDDSIRFLSRDQSGQNTTRWEGIYLDNEDGSRMSYCVIRGSRRGLRIQEASPLIQFCTINDNINLDGEGGGIYLKNSGAKIVGCIIEENEAVKGGAIYVRNSIPIINNCIIRGNSALQGGALYIHFLASALLQNNLIYGNTTSGEESGAIAILDHTAPRIVNNTIVDNTGGGFSVSIRSVPVIINSILWNNGGSEIQMDESSNALVSYCDIQDIDPAFEGGTNYSVDPLFDSETGDYPYLLSAGSPMIDTGNPERIYRDHFIPPSLGTNRCDIGAYGGPLSGSWTVPEVSISLFQNPAFPHWIDIFVTSLNAFETPPVCSLEIGESIKTIVPLNPNPSDPYTFMGDYEVESSCRLFITVDAVLVGGFKQRVSRTYELVILQPGGGTIQMVGVNGEFILKPDSYDDVLTVLCGFETEPLKPADGKLFLSPCFFIRGLDNPLTEPGRMVVEFDPEASGWLDVEQEELGIYRFESGRWYRLKGGYEEGFIDGLIDRGGVFVIAWDEYYTPSMEDNTPYTTQLISAYPNPFNQKVTIEFDLDKISFIHLSVYNLSGRKVAVLRNETLSPGTYYAVWDGGMEDGSQLPSGIYWARLEEEGGARLVKLLLLR